jgi:tetratricopeptide (TPR) repeat protein
MFINRQRLVSWRQNAAFCEGFVMRIDIVRTFIVAAAALSLAALHAANTNLADALSPKSDAATTGNDAFAAAPSSDENQATVSQPFGASVGAEPGLLGSDPNDDLSAGKKYYRVANYGMAERSFRRAAELHPRDAEAWLGLAASYDQLRRFDLADRAYEQAIVIAGPTVEIINNQGYSYLLRGDIKRARAKLAVAQRKAPENKYVLNNIRLLEQSAGQGKAVE